MDLCCASSTVGGSSSITTGRILIKFCVNIPIDIHIMQNKTQIGLDNLFLNCYLDSPIYQHKCAYISETIHLSLFIIIDDIYKVMYCLQFGMFIQWSLRWEDTVGVLTLQVKSEGNFNDKRPNGSQKMLFWHPIRCPLIGGTTVFWPWVTLRCQIKVTIGTNGW